ncbi:MAG TPA: thioesterase family protein [Solirubrobacterales bacterium]|nr:thioesterase family protein [Solirubrobacterales bacterium]
MSQEAFFSRRGDLYVPSELTRGPWDPDSQHAGPPAALIGREIERLDGADERQVGRITFEILRPVPIAPMRVEARVARPGRSVELVEAALFADDGEVMRSSAWRLRSRELEIPPGLASADGPGLIGTSPSTLRPGFAPPGVADGRQGRFPPTGQSVGYHTAMEYVFVRGDFAELGPALVWMRMRYPLVAGEEPSPLERVLVAADSGNGVSATLDWNRYVFINVDLTVHLHRALEGEWVCLDAITIPEASGIGVADTALYDGRGPIGRAMQTLLVDEG